MVGSIVDVCIFLQYALVIYDGVVITVHLLRCTPAGEVPMGYQFSIIPTHLSTPE